MHLDLRFTPSSSGRWHSRLKATDTHRLTLHNVYVLPTRAGWMMLVTLAVLMLATINYQLNLGYALIFLLMGAGVVGLYLAHRAMTRITLRLDTSKALHGIAGEDVEVAIQVVNGHPSPTSSTPNLPSTEHVVTQLDATGLQQLPLLTCETRYPLGLLRLWSVWRIHSQVQIDPPKAAPNLTPPNITPPQTVPPKEASQPLDAIKDDFRAYRVGDAPKDLLWKSVAKRPDSPSSWGVRDSNSNDAQQANSDKPAQSKAAASRAPIDLQASLMSLMSLQRSDQLLLCVLLAIALPFFLHLNLAYPLLACTLIAARLWLTTQQDAQAPKWLQLPLIAGLGALMWWQFRSFNGIEASVSACVGLLGIKALELPRAKLAAPTLQDHKTQPFTRDRWVLVFLGLFTLSAHFLVSQSLLSSTLVVLGAIGLIYVLVDAHGAGAPKLRTTALLVLLGVPIMLVLFFLFPRFAPLWTLIPPKTSTVSGLSNEMRVGDIGQISLDNRIMLRLKMDPPAKLQSNDLYLRGPVLPYFDGRTWRTYVKGQSSDKLPPTELDWQGKEPVTYTVFEDSQSRTHTVNPANNLTRNNAQNTSFPYLQVARALPANSNPRTHQWLQSLKSDSRYAAYTASDWSSYLLRHLQTGGFSYSLEPGLYGQHMVDELLFDRVAGNKLGFCEHYANFFVIAMRQLGVPAQVVTGYQGAEINPIDGLFVVRNRNAHAWSEYWGDAGDERGLGWQRVDPTAVLAPGRIQSAEAFNQAPEQVAAQKGFGAFTLSTPWLKEVRQTWEASSHAWESWMQGYNQGTQLSILKQLGFDSPDWKSVVQLLNAALVLLLVLGAAAYAFAGQSKQDPWLQLLEAARRKLQQSGLVLAPNASPKEMATQLSQRFQSAAAQPNIWLLALEQARYSPQSRALADLSTLKRRFKSAFAPLSS